MIGKSIIAVALVASFVAVANASYHLKSDGYDRDVCYGYNTQVGSLFGPGPVKSCETCCLQHAMKWELLFNNEAKQTYCACKAAEPLDVMDRSCWDLELNEAGCGECCKNKRNKAWEAVKNIEGKEECRCKGPFVEYQEPKEEPKKHHHHLFHHSN